MSIGGSFVRCYSYTVVLSGYMVNHLMWNFFQVLISRSFQLAILSNLQR